MNSKLRFSSAALRRQRNFTLGVSAISLLFAAAVAQAQDGVSQAQDAPPPKVTEAQIQYSPYPEQDFPNQVFYGDTHLHTSYSTDAGMVGCTLGPEDAYRFVRGETVTSSTGVPARLRRPLDFLVVADHSENLGLAPAISDSNPELLKNEWGKMEHDLVKSGLEGGLRPMTTGWPRPPSRKIPLRT